jgi:hypothetical protein
LRDNRKQSALIPLWLKIAYTLFVCILVQVYWRQYGPANFLWFSDIALLVTVIGPTFEPSKGFLEDQRQPKHSRQTGGAASSQDK